MDPIDYWLMAREYSVWNATVAALQFWTADLEAHVLSSPIEQVYNAFFYSTSMHLLCQQSDEILFSCFMTTLNAAFESKLTLEDEGYESGSQNFNIPTPLRWTSKIHHVSNVENVSFDPDLVTPYNTGTKESHCRLVHRHLTFSSSEEMMMTLQQMRFHLLTVHHQCSTTQIPFSDHPPSTPWMHMLP